MEVEILAKFFAISKRGEGRKIEKECLLNNDLCIA